MDPEGQLLICRRGWGRRSALINQPWHVITECHFPYILEGFSAQASVDDATPFQESWAMAAVDLEMPPLGQQGSAENSSSDDEPEAAETDTLLPPSAPASSAKPKGRAALPRWATTVVVKRKGPPRRPDAEASGCRRALARYSAAAEDEPFRTSSLTCAVLLGASDIVEQLLVERRSWSAFDPGVIGAVVVYGTVYNGPMNVIIYRLYEKTYREETMGRVQAVLAKVVTDQLVSSPFVYTPGAQ